MKKVTIPLTKEIMKDNPIFGEYGFSPGTTVTITAGKEDKEDLTARSEHPPTKPIHS